MWIYTHLHLSKNSTLMLALQQLYGCITAYRISTSALNVLVKLMFWFMTSVHLLTICIKVLERVYHFVSLIDVQLADYSDDCFLIVFKRLSALVNSFHISSCHWTIGQGVIFIVFIHMELCWYLLSRWLIKIKWKVHYKHLTLLNGLLTHLVYASKNLYWEKTRMKTSSWNRCQDDACVVCLCVCAVDTVFT